MKFPVVQTPYPTNEKKHLQRFGVFVCCRCCCCLFSFFFYCSVFSFFCWVILIVQRQRYCSLLLFSSSSSFSLFVCNSTLYLAYIEGDGLDIIGLSPCNLRHFGEFLQCLVLVENIYIIKPLIQVVIQYVIREFKILKCLFSSPIFVYLNPYNVLSEKHLARY